ncbi:hypothetical protein K5V07_12900 [Flavobacterium sp. CHNK8]|uniref:hypothetical protein n=1 Tax=Flavobacterium sp. CHNK8 TaxID=2871165 RepID=UPI001C8D838B|nr:hypothetical protein [Flavobacterium sp. CHNK8]QZK91341.1 hypothetical protein K5V07_12900 [Flavobacterium sp. CHNK8]
MKNNIILKNIYILGLCLNFFLCFNTVYSQSFADQSIEFELNKCQLTFSKPENYFRIEAPSGYFSIHPDFNQGGANFSLINKESETMTSITMIAYPKPINKITKYLIAKGEMNNFSPKAVAAQIDTTLSKMMDVEALHLKKMNADRGIIYNIKVDGKYLGIYPRCKKIEVYKDNIARVELLFFYKENQENQVKEEIEKSWGMLRFK